VKYKLKKPIHVGPSTINKLEVGLSYFGFIQVYYGEDGPITVSDLYDQWPDHFDLIDTSETKIQIVINLSAQYVELQRHYGFDEDAMADRISLIAEKICSKI